MRKAKERKIRKKIADRVWEKMAYMNECPNSRDIICNIILHKEDKYEWKLHCDTDCWETGCVNYKGKDSNHGN